MKKLICVAAAALGLAGCAIGPTPERMRAEVDGAQDWELCYGIISGKATGYLRELIAQSIQSRRINCSDHLGMVNAKINADGVRAASSAAADVRNMQMLQLGQQLMQPPVAPALPVVAPPMSCRTTKTGGIWNTYCN